MRLSSTLRSSATRQSSSPCRDAPLSRRAPALQRTQRVGSNGRWSTSEHASRNIALHAFARQGLMEDAAWHTTPAETFYDLLNVPPTASRRKIRQAYLDVMKDCHPDRSNQEAHEFCVMLNEIYETLSDPAKRAAYDAISGLSEDSINPFTDATHERDQVFVDEMACIGCRNCANVCPKSYKIEEAHGRARVVRQNADSDEKLQESIDTCPVSCIHWVSAPQLALLEQAMARMERVAVWSMFMGGGSARDVFLEASLAWEKRQSNAQRMRAAAAAASQQASNAAPWAKWWSNVMSFRREGASGSRFYESMHKARNGAWAANPDDAGGSGSSDEDWAGSDPPSSSQQQPLSEKQARGIATLAARAARASRTWRTMQEVSQRLRPLPQLTAESSGSRQGDLATVRVSSSSVSDS